MLSFYYSLIYNKFVGDNMEKYNVSFKKKFGQNFLKDNRIVKRIVDICDIDNNSLVIEVGPGGAIMTKELATRAKKVIAYEIDKDLENESAIKLNSYSNVDIIFKDFLVSDLKEDVSKYEYEKLFFVSNVPYYITTPIILKLMNSDLKFNKIVMMVQKEVGNRFSTAPGSREYGSITVLLNYFYNIKKEIFVSKKEFIPVPKVDSVVVSFTEKEEKLPLKDFDYFEKLLKEAFQYKRKNIRNNLKKYNLEIVEKVLNRYNFDLNARAEMLSVETFVDLANELYDSNC